MSFDIFVITYRGTNFLPKLMDMLLFSTEKELNFHFFLIPLFSGIAGTCVCMWKESASMQVICCLVSLTSKR